MGIGIPSVLEFCSVPLFILKDLRLLYLKYNNIFAQKKIFFIIIKYIFASAEKRSRFVGVAKESGKDPFISGMHAVEIRQSDCISVHSNSAG